MRFFLSASDSGVGTNAFQITCPYLERLTTTTTTSTVTSSAPATFPKPSSTAKVTTSTTSTRSSNIASTTQSESTSAVSEVKETVVRQDVPRESSTIYLRFTKIRVGWKLYFINKRIINSLNFSYQLRQQFLVFILPVEVIITVAILVPVASIGIVLVSIYLWRR